MLPFKGNPLAAAVGGVTLGIAFSIIDSRRYGLEVGIVVHAFAAVLFAVGLASFFICVDMGEALRESGWEPFFRVLGRFWLFGICAAVTMSSVASYMLSSSGAS